MRVAKRMLTRQSTRNTRKPIPVHRPEIGLQNAVSALIDSDDFAVVA